MWADIHYLVRKISILDRAHDFDRTRYRKMRGDEAITMSKTREWRQAKLGREIEMNDIHLTEHVSSCTRLFQRLH